MPRTRLLRGTRLVVTRRLCLDRLDLAKSRRTTATAEPPGAPGGTPDPADRMTLHDEVRQALSVVIDRLSPAERTSFIARAWCENTTAAGLAERFIAVCEGGDMLATHGHCEWAFAVARSPLVSESTRVT